MDDLVIVSDPNIMLGKPVIRGTRIMVEHILRELAGGMTIDDLLEAHPHITREGIKAALEFAAESVRFDRVLMRYHHGIIVNSRGTNLHWTWTQAC